MSQQSANFRLALKDEGAAGPSSMLEHYFKSSPTITEKLQINSKKSGCEIKALKIKETKEYLGDWQNSWDKMAASKE
ncbi:hypothetical protein BDP55DRAFT_732885 [Colletotrichum godetiae]|uniref:Uncharacterized protein n=1 Tax=Colletotrichum godetiae TaxID=1209918 RepID=A0AAJ0ENH8_9PEZI|nr:uncharacterized protein BDP55DRAFT_732885 [Colletotrichum godetiae]KAK1659850.1 hypothetical protein BDP55DRAFT_732885 [Colletotrichum godetiae]